MIKVVTDYKLIIDFILNDKELFDRISDDYTDIINWKPQESTWLGWFDGETCKALLSTRSETAIVLIIHIHIPEKYRGKDSFKMGNDLLSYLEQNCNKRFNKINAKIPLIYPDVIKYAEKNGFEKEGIDRGSHIKNGKIYDRAILGKIIKR